MRQVLDGHADFALEGKSLESNTRRIAAWKPPCGRGWWAVGAYGRDAEMSRAYQNWCLASGFSPAVPLHHSLSAYALSSSRVSPLGTRAQGARRDLADAGGKGKDEGGNKCLAILDPLPGAGHASAALAVWARHFEDAQPHVAMVYHRIAACGGGTRPVERELVVVMAQLKARLGLIQELPGLNDVKEQWPVWLDMVADRQSVLIVLDGLERLQHPAGTLTGKLWEWMPTRLHANCHVFLGVGDHESTGFSPLVDAAAGGQGARTPQTDLVLGEYESLCYLLANAPTREQVKQVLHDAVARSLSSPHLASAATQDAGQQDDANNSRQEQQDGNRLEEHQALVLRGLEELALDGALNMMLVCTVLIHDIELVHPVASAQAEPHPAADPAAPRLAAAGSDPVQASLERRGSLRMSVRGGWARTGDEHEVMRVEDSGQLMLRVLEHKMLELAWLPYASSSLWTLLELVASSYMGVTEQVLLLLLQQALLQDTSPPAPNLPRASTTRPTFARLNALALLRALRPYMWSGSTWVHGGEVLAKGVSEWKGVAITKRALLSDLKRGTPAPASHLSRPVALRYTPECVSEQIWMWSSSGDEARLSGYVSNVEVMLTAYHSEYWRDYTAVWARLSSSNQRRVELPINLRISAQAYGEVPGTDGADLPPGRLHANLKLAHQLLVVRFLSTQAAAAEQAQKLLEYLGSAHSTRQGVGEEGRSAKEAAPDGDMTEALALHAALVHAGKGEREKAIGALSHVLDNVAKVQRAAAADRQEVEASYWRERAYVQGFCADCATTSLELLGRLLHEACQLTGAIAACASHLQRVQAEAGACTALELVKAHSRWRLARVQCDLAMHTEALDNSLESLATLSTHLSPLDRHLKDLQAWTELLHSKLNRKAAGAAADVKELAKMIDLHLQEDVAGDEPDDVPGPDLSQVPVLLLEFDTLFWQQQYVAAYAKVRRVLKGLQHQALANKGLWIDASLKFSRVLMRLAYFDEAIKHLRHVLQVERQHDTAAEHLHVVEPSIELICHLIEKGSYAEAQAALRQLPNSDLLKRLDDKHPVVCRLMYAQGSILAVQGFFDEALSKLRAAEGGQMARLVPGDTIYTQLFDTRLRLVEVLHGKHQHDKAEGEANALQLQLEKFFGKHSLEAAHLNFMGGCRLLDAANYKAADTVMRDVSKVVSMCVGSKRAMHHPLLLSATAKIGEIGEQQGRFGESDHIYLKTLDALAASHLDMHASLCVAQIREGYSKLQLPQGRPGAAMDLLLQGFGARREVPGLAPNALFTSYVKLALLEIALGQLSEARDSLKNLCAIQADGHVELILSQEADVSYVQAMLALEVKEDLAYSEERMRQTLALRQSFLPSHHPLVALTQLDLAGVMLEQHRIEETEVLLSQVTSKLTVLYGKNSRHLARVKRLLARVYLQRGAYVDGETMVREALAIDASQVFLEELLRSGLEKPVSVADKTPAVLEDLELLARLSYLQGKVEHAQILVRKCEAMATEVYGSKRHPIIARCLVAFALIRLHAGHHVEAYRMLEQGLQLQESMLGGSHPHVIMTQLEMVEMQHTVGDVPAALERCTRLRSTLLSLGSHTALQVMGLGLWSNGTTSPISLPAVAVSASVAPHRLPHR